MVKFGLHLDAFVASEEASTSPSEAFSSAKTLYVVPYTTIRDAFIEKPRSLSTDADSNADADAMADTATTTPTTPTSEEFRCEWRRALSRASADFERHTSELWRRVFNGIRDEENARGAIPDRALRMYISRASRPEAEELLAWVRRIHSAALTNAEALRKLAKKYDKKKINAGDGNGGIVGPADLSCELLPEVYAANFTVGQPTLEAGLALLRHCLGMDVDDEEEDGEEGVGGVHYGTAYYDSSHHLAVHDEATATATAAAAGLPSIQTDDTANLVRAINANDDDDDAVVEGIRMALSRADPHLEAIDRRRDELAWLGRLVSSIASDEIRHLVAHRGFHSVKDRSDRRPLENSLAAYESAWISGVHLCECDIALTKDERLILAHDEDFRRLALDPSSPLCNRKVTDLTFREIMACPLKTGSRPPLLIDVLRSALTIGGKSRLIIEIKPGNSEAGTALARMFMRHPELMDRCAVVMSFDAFAIHTLRREMAALERAGYGNFGRFGGGGSGEGGVGEGGSTVGAVGVAAAVIRPPAGSLVSLPTAMSLGNIGMRIDSFQMPSSALHQRYESPEDGQLRRYRIEDEDDNGGGGGNTASLAATKHGSSDHFGVGLSDAKRDSFHFSPFLGAVQKSPSSRSMGQPQPHQVQDNHGRQVNTRGELSPEDLSEVGKEISPKEEPQRWRQQQQQHRQLKSSNSLSAVVDAGPEEDDDDDDEKDDDNDNDAGGSSPTQTPRRREYPPPHPPRPGMPHLMLLTVSRPPKKECELRLDVSDPESRSLVDSWVRCSDGSLHGLYLQFQKEMLEPEGMAGLRELTDRGYLIGVWGANGRDPDDYHTFHKLVREAGVSFVNSDLPKRFKMGEPMKRGVSFEL